MFSQIVIWLGAFLVSSPDGEYFGHGQLFIADVLPSAPGPEIVLLEMDGSAIVFVIDWEAPLVDRGPAFDMPVRWWYRLSPAPHDPRPNPRLGKSGHYEAKKLGDR
ncbi:MAG: hypothetical protein COU07_02460 [Candidatus Harrisonbacteria bacterium CG10_big_fil_rev_8_21_14_0_10_40_38]|uniref:Uncharacterized protein n=1 Tax=Candidatus Harrisonbacteria bacterium CG10_big_fil_rev_8_21_14_0_10_40_38 TaxID=1974583 RepID=A0A2H0US01_9BACT|nr:MAG: hypothetical protein COU07_02460 [Candidatus Harrisonbacteria bacterium CG10_big_fil_rev_8_21_14_0_10_40_38]